MRSTPRSARLRAFSAAGKSGPSLDARVENFAKPGRKRRCAPPRPATVVAGGARQATTFLVPAGEPLPSVALQHPTLGPGSSTVPCSRASGARLPLPRRRRARGPAATCVGRAWAAADPSLEEPSSSPRSTVLGTARARRARWRPSGHRTRLDGQDRVGVLDARSLCLLLCLSLSLQLSARPSGLTGSAGGG